MFCNNIVCMFSPQCDTAAKMRVIACGSFASLGPVSGGIWVESLCPITRHEVFLEVSEAVVEAQCYTLDL